MNAKTAKFSTVMIILVFSMFLLSCQGSIEGELVLENTEGVSTHVNLEDWPGDTLTIAICITDEDGEEECIYVDIEKPESDQPIEPPGDTISYNFRGLSTGNYHLGIYFQDVSAGATGPRELITFYHSALGTLGLIKDRGSAETIPIEFFHPNVNLGVIEITY